MSERVPVGMPAVVARTPIASPLLPVRVVRSLLEAGRERLGELQGWGFEELMVDGVGVRGVIATVQALQTLCALPADRLSRLSWADWPGATTVPRLTVEVLTALCYAHSVDAEIAALVCGLEPRKRAMVCARWGVGGDPQILEHIGSSFGITRERARQIIQGAEQQILASGLRLPLASAAVMELAGVGGALPADTYEVLMRYSPTPISPRAIRLLPLLHQLRCIPEIAFDSDFGLWLSAAGRERWIESGEAARLAYNARRTARDHLGRISAVPHAVADRLSPFGREHTLWLIGGRGVSFVDVGEHSLRVPARDSALLRHCRKTLVVTGPLQLDELNHALRHSGFSQLSEDLLRCVLRTSSDFTVADDVVAVSPGIRTEDVLSPAEQAGFRLLESHGGAMLWLDFLDGMIQSGFSAPMANIVLRKPAVRQIGPATYALRGREIAPEIMQRLRRRRSELLRRGGPIVQVRQIAGAVVVDYELNRFAMQGVLPAPGALKGVPRSWTATFSEKDERRLKVANNFVWPLRSWFLDRGLVPGDRLRVTFMIEERQAYFEVVQRRQSFPEARLRTREEQITRALFGEHI